MPDHFLFQLAENFLGLAVQKALGVRRVQRVLFGRNMANARRRTALDLVKQARPGAVVKHRVFAGAQPEYFLQQQDRVLDRPGARVRTEIAVLFFNRAAVVGNARKGRGLGSAAFGSGLHTGQLEVGIAFIVPKQDVEFRVQRFDQVVFQQQRLGFGAHHRGLHPHDLRHHVADTGAAMVFLEIAGDPLFQVARLADIQHAARSVKVPVNTGQGRQRGHFAEQLGVKFVGWVHGA